MRTKECVIILIILGLLGGKLVDVSQCDIMDNPQSLDEHILCLDLIDNIDSVEKGINWILTQNNFDVGTLWVLGKLCQDTNSKRLKELYQRELGAARKDDRFKYYLKLFDNEVVIEKIPKSKAISRADLMIMEDWLIAAVNCKDFTPSEEILKELFDNRYSGYLSTHQLLAIMWLKEQGYQDGRIEPKIKEIVEQMVLEQTDKDKFTDLFVERIAFILYAGYREKIERRWIETILDAQKEDGHWIPPPPEINAYISDLHTTILAVWALIQYDKKGILVKLLEQASKQKK